MPFRSGYDFLKKAEEGTMARAKIFMDRYFEDGAIYNGHVKPQSEYFAPFSSDCSWEGNSFTQFWELSPVNCRCARIVVSLGSMIFINGNMQNFV